jgi:hypothetical protein
MVGDITMVDIGSRHTIILSIDTIMVATSLQELLPELSEHPL